MQNGRETYRSMRPAVHDAVLTGYRVVIVGAGFGGLFAARFLKRAPVEITLVDRTNHHLFQPLLYQVATGIHTRLGDGAYAGRAAEACEHAGAARRGGRCRPPRED